MDRAQTNRVAMFKTVNVCFDTHNSIWSAVAPMATAVQEFKDNIAAIDATAQKQEKPTKGAVSDKADAREALEDTLFLTCEALALLAESSHDNDLRALTAVTPSTLHRFDHEELANRAANVIESANSKKTELATLHVTQANLDELEQALQSFNSAKEKPRAVVTERVAHTESLADLIRNNTGILRTRLDRHVSLFRRTNPEFVAAYRSARVVIDRAASHTQTKTAGSPTPPATPQG